MEEKLLKVNNLETSFFTHSGEVKAIRNISFEVGYGEAIGIVGESGSGKSVTSLSIMGLLQNPGKVIGGQILYKGENLLNKSNSDMRKIRGNEIAMIFQDPMTSLNPLFTIGDQISEAIKEHQKVSNKLAKEKSIEMLKLVGIPSPEYRINCFPHEFSGGMRQRAMIAMALSCEPNLLIADEPTTALDVTIQAQMLKLIKDLNVRLNTAVMLITHDLGVVASSCSRIIVMYGGQIMEEGNVEDIFYSPRHPYTMGLLKSIPKVSSNRQRLIPIKGTPPDLINPPIGCPFYARCEFSMKICKVKAAPDFIISDKHMARCWLMHKNSPTYEKYEKQKGGVRNVG